MTRGEHISLRCLPFIQLTHIAPTVLQGHAIQVIAKEQTCIAWTANADLRTKVSNVVGNGETAALGMAFAVPGRTSAPWANANLETARSRRLRRSQQDYHGRRVIPRMDHAVVPMALHAMSSSAIAAIRMGSAARGIPTVEQAGKFVHVNKRIAARDFFFFYFISTYIHLASQLLDRAVA